MRIIRVALLSAAIAWGGAAQATTVVVFIDPMTLEKHARVIDTPGPDRVLLCTQPPSLSGCTVVPAKKRA